MAWGQHTKGKKMQPNDDIGVLCTYESFGGVHIAELDFDLPLSNLEIQDSIHILFKERYPKIPLDHVIMRVNHIHGMGCVYDHFAPMYLLVGGHVPEFERMLIETGIEALYQATQNKQSCKIVHKTKNILNPWWVNRSPHSFVGNPEYNGNQKEAEHEVIQELHLTEYLNKQNQKVLVRLSIGLHETTFSNKDSLTRSGVMARASRKLQQEYPNTRFIIMPGSGNGTTASAHRKHLKKCWKHDLGVDHSRQITDSIVHTTLAIINSSDKIDTLIFDQIEWKTTTKDYYHDTTYNKRLTPPLLRLGFGTGAYREGQLNLLYYFAFPVIPKDAYRNAIFYDFEQGKVLGMKDRVLGKVLSWLPFTTLRAFRFGNHQGYLEEGKLRHDTRINCTIIKMGNWVRVFHPFEPSVGSSRYHILPLMQAIYPNHAIEEAPYSGGHQFYIVPKGVFHRQTYFRRAYEAASCIYGPHELLTFLNQLIATSP